MKIATKNANIMKQHEILKVSVKNVSSTVVDINKRIEKWPIQPTEQDDSKEIEKDPVSFADIAHVFDLFGNLVGPLEAGEAYKRLIEARKKVHESKRKFQSLKANIDNVGPEAVLQEATNLRPLLSALRKAESDFVYVLMHQWRAAIQTIDSDLHDIHNKISTE